MLAAVQGFVLKHLLFGGKKGDAKKYDVVCSFVVILYINIAELQPTLTFSLTCTRLTSSDVFGFTEQNIFSLRVLLI